MSSQLFCPQAPKAPIVSEFKCLVRNVYYEARGESIDGQIAVAKVTINRLKTHAPTLCRVVYQSNQFSWTMKPITKGIDKIAWERAEIASIIAYNMVGFEATHYHNFSVTPKWGYKKVAIIGNHIFYQQK